MLKSVADVQPAQWVLDGLDAPNTHRVGAIVPRGFERYARIFHPGWRLEGRERVRARWADVATPTRCRAHALMQWQSIAASANDILDPPDEGTLPPEVARPLREILSLHTGPEPCWLAAWRGLGGGTTVSMSRKPGSSKPRGGNGICSVRRWLRWICPFTRSSTTEYIRPPT